MRTYTGARLKRRGNYWAAVADYIDENGARHEIQKSTGIPCGPKTGNVNVSGKGSTQAKAFLRQWIAELREQEAAKTSTDTTTLLKYVNSYIDAREASGSIERSTVLDYRKTAKHQLSKRGRAAIARVPIGELTAQQVRDFEAWLVAPKPKGCGYSAVSAIKAHRLLVSALSQAVYDGLIPSSPMYAVKPPKKRRAAPNALTQEGAAAVLRELANMEPTATVVAAIIALYTGMRRAEICGLRWSDVDLAGSQITVARAIGVSASGPYIKDTKTDTVRTVPIPQGLAPVLQSARERMEDTLRELSLPVDVEPLYVIGDVLGNFTSPATVSKGWADISKSLALKGTEGKAVTFHDLRHTFATVAIAGGVDVKTVSSILGHANAAITLNVYASADPSAKRRAAAQIDALLG